MTAPTTHPVLSRRSGRASGSIRALVPALVPALAALIGIGCTAGPVAASPSGPTTARSAPGPAPTDLFARIYANLRAWPGVAGPDFNDVREHMQGGEAPISPLVLLLNGVKEDGCAAVGGPPSPEDRPILGRYLYIALVGGEVMAVYLDQRFEIMSVAYRPASQGFSLAPMVPPEGEGDACILLVLHEHAGTGLDRDATVRVELDREHLRLRLISERARKRRSSPSELP